MPFSQTHLNILNHLISSGHITLAQRDEIVGKNPDGVTGDQLRSILISEFKVNSYPYLRAQGIVLSNPSFDLRLFNKPDELFEVLDMKFCQSNHVIYLGSVGMYVLIGSDKPVENSFKQDLEKTFRKKVIIYQVVREEMVKFFVKKEDTNIQFNDVVEQLGLQYTNPEDGDEEVLAEGEEQDENSGPIVDLANRIIEDAYFSGASDIHIEPQEKQTNVRYRIDGLCQQKLTLPASVNKALIARLKIMCDLNIAEQRLPQDGRIKFKQYTKKNVDLDLRVSTAPLNYGEGAVMRILDKKKSTLPLPQLGFSEENLTRYRDVIRQPYGMVLHCGPTGSGKSMTLYAALNEINAPDIVIRTIEDPIEYTLPNICQMQMNRTIGLTFAAALKAFLRQDPDIILVGEIRDTETAGIAVEAALTGHLLISTLHTNDAPSTVARLTEMGVEPFMVSASLLCVCAQRLLRRVCKDCARMAPPSESELRVLKRARPDLDWTQMVKAHTEGCTVCGNSGYKGRAGIHELMTSNPELIEAINKEAETAELKRICMKTGMKTLHQDSVLKVFNRMTTLEEALVTVPIDQELILDPQTIAAATPKH